MTAQPHDATTVAVVSLHRQKVTSMVLLPSRWRYCQFRAEAEYDCKVVDPELLLMAGCCDVQPDLQRYLADDPNVRALAFGMDPLDRATLQVRLAAYAMARNRISPPYVPGMVCSLVCLKVETHGPDGVETADARRDSHGSRNGHPSLTGVTVVGDSAELPPQAYLKY